MRARQTHDSRLDSTNPRRAEDRRDASDETPYRLLIEEMSEGALTATGEGVVLYANKCFAGMLDVPLERVIGARVSDWVMPADRPALETLLRDAAERQAKREFELLRASSETIPTYWCANRLPGRDPPRLAIIVTDLTEERQHQRLVATQEALKASETRLLAATRLRDEFLATISHELRTPLNAILGWAALLKAGKLGPEKTADAIEIIERNARVQVRLTDDLLDVSRVITGKLQLDVRPVALLPLVQAVLESLQPTFAARQIVVETEWQTDDDAVSGDPDRLQQVIWNLLSNAAKFTPARGKVCVSLGRTGTHLALRVSDNGVGIRPEFLPYVFDRFRQGDSTPTRRHSGLGLGLAIVRHLVELHGGTVDAESDGEGRGAAFTVRLPVRALREPRGRAGRTGERSRLHAVHAPGIELHGVTVLIVDDQPDAQALVKTVLQEAGAETVGASAVGDALELLTRFTPDVLIADVGMPGEDGYSLIRQVRQQERARGTHLPAVALTAFTRAEDRALALESGFDAHLRKPVARDDLLVAIAKALGRLRAV